MINTSNQSHSLFSSQPWENVIKSSYGVEFNLNRLPDDQYLYTANTSTVFGNKINGLPFCDYSPSSVFSKEDLAQYLQDVKSCYPNHLVTLNLLETGLPGKELSKLEFKIGSCIHQIKLAGFNADRDYHLSFARNLKAAKKKGHVYIRASTSRHAFSEFMDLNYTLRKSKFQQIPQPKRYFEGIWKEFLSKDAGFVLTASVNSTPISAFLVLKYGNGVYYKFGASVPWGLDWKPNHLLFDHLIHWAKSEGYDYLDLGGSGIGNEDKGIRTFKERMGGLRKDVWSYSYVPPNMIDHVIAAKQDVLDWVSRTLALDDRHLAEKLANYIYPNFA